jgi:hypothetical protein
MRWRMKAMHRSKFDAEWRARCSVRVAEKAELETMVKTHYLGKWPGVVVLRQAMILDGQPAGMILWALPPRETAKRYGGETWELARLWIDDFVPSNAETWLIGQSVRWIKVNRRDVRFLVSYADPSHGHEGTIYKAANWIDDGMTDQGRKTPRCDYRDADTGKMYSRKAHVPEGTRLERVPRVSKHRYRYVL